jgi:hypothetical protein
LRDKFASYWFFMFFDHFPNLFAIFTLSLANLPAVAQVTAWTPAPMEAIPVELPNHFSATPTPVVLVAPRNGSASAPVVFRNANPNTIRISDLQGPSGGVYPVSHVEIRYATHALPDQNWSMPFYDALLPTAKEANAGRNPLVVWLTVRIPPRFPPGNYQGHISAAGFSVPVVLQVGAYELPDPPDWISWAALVNSPDAVAHAYQTGLYSEAHFERMIPSLRLMGQLGNNVVYIPVERNTQYSNRHGMLAFRKTRNGFEPDFRLVDRYLDLYTREVGRPRVLFLYLYEPRYADKYNRSRMWISTVDASGRLREDELPGIGTGQADEVWKAVIDGMRERVSARGWSPDIVMIGTASDRRPDKEEVDFFNRFDPPLRWAVFSHWRGDPQHANPDLSLDFGLKVGLAEVPYPPDLGQRFSKDRQTMGGGWQEQYGIPWLTSNRGRNNWDSPPMAFRLVPDQSVHGRFIGFTRMGLDGWQTPHPEVDEMRSALQGNAAWGRLWRRTVQAILAPGPEGAVATVRFEMLREGIQEAEARILLERALANPGLSQSLRREITAFLPEWFNTRYWRASGHLGFEVPENWRELTLELFNLAGKAQEELGEDLLPPGQTPFRTWTSTVGTTVEARLVDRNDTEATLERKNGQLLTVPIQSLSAADQALIRK